jgi:WXXGXW repeat (2 copies)
MNFNRPVVRWLLMAVVVLSFSAASFAQIAVGISVRVGPPALPVYAQPICPAPGYMWTPGYWGWNDDAGYYWVPGTWVVAPVGLLWTPGYWGWGGGFYAWHPGYWGPHIGFYGGINYGFGYGGVGFAGGEWRGGAFYYNRSVTNVSVTNVTNVYTRTVVVNENRVAFNGGEGGVRAEATAEERVAEHEQHTAALSAQTEHEHLASQNRENFASENHGRPAIAATARAGDFSGHSAIPARAAGGEYHAPAMSPKEARGPSTPMKSGGNDGFRPFTPPNKSASGSSGAGNNSRSESKDKTERAPESKPPKSESHPAAQHKSSPPPKKPANSKEERHKEHKE